MDKQELKNLIKELIKNSQVINEKIINEKYLNFSIRYIQSWDKFEFFNDLTENKKIYLEIRYFADNNNLRCQVSNTDIDFKKKVISINETNFLDKTIDVLNENIELINKKYHTINDNESKFRNYLLITKNQHGNNFTESRINTFIKILKTDLPEKLNSMGESTQSFLNIEDSEYLEGIKQRCHKNGDLHDWNISIYSMEPSAALLNYLNFLFYKKNSINSERISQPQIKTKNIILYGAPGVGKTHNYQNLITMIETEYDEKEIFNTITTNTKTELNSENFQKIKNDKRIEFVTFHQNYSYEDFIEGLRPQKDGNILPEDGLFKKLVDDAKKSEKNFYIVIDEINRGNISKIFGELITLIEESKRAKGDGSDYEVTLPYSKKKFKVPSNLYIIATMNSTDKSIATIDIALRRRFTFLKMQPNPKLVTNEEAKVFMMKLNSYIKKKLGEDFMLGHSYFMCENLDLEFVIEYKIKPLLEEYFYSYDKTPDQIISEAKNETIEENE